MTAAIAAADPRVDRMNRVSAGRLHARTTDAAGDSWRKNWGLADSCGHLWRSAAALGLGGQICGRCWATR